MHVWTFVTEISARIIYVHVKVYAHIASVERMASDLLSSSNVCCVRLE